jgi:ferritin
MLKPKVLEALNNQVNAELDSAYLYLSMAAWFESKNFRGMARWMRTQSHEEWGHGMKIYDFIVSRSGRVRLAAVDTPKADWDSVTAIFEDSYKHECKVTGLINGLMKLAESESDFATRALLQWFVTEQVEEEAQVEFIVEKLKLMGESNIALFMLDEALGKRGGD